MYEHNALGYWSGLALCLTKVRSSRACCPATALMISCDDMSRLVGKPTICIGENKGADQLRGNREADQRLCFRYSDSIIPLLLKSKISSF